MTVANERFALQRSILGGQATVTDAQTGEVVFRGNDTAAAAYARQHNAEFAQRYALLEQLLASFVTESLTEHVLPWRMELADASGVRITASDGTKIVTVVDLPAAMHVVQLAERLELERYPDGRPRD